VKVNPLRKIRNLQFWSNSLIWLFYIFFHEFTICNAQTDNQYMPKTKSLKPENKTKNYLGIQLIAGSGKQEMKSGVVAHLANGQGIAQDVLVTPGGGTGVELYYGRALLKNIRLGLYSGYQVSPGSVKLINAKVRFTKMTLVPMVQYSFPLWESSRIQIGIGATAFMASQVYFQETTGYKTTYRIKFNPTIGPATQFLFQQQMGLHGKFHIGVRLHWLRFRYSGFELNGQKSYLNSIERKPFLNANGTGTNFEIGYAYGF